MLKVCQHGRFYGTKSQPNIKQQITLWSESYKLFQNPILNDKFKDHPSEIKTLKTEHLETSTS